MISHECIESFNMKNYESNCIVLRTILGSCLSDINKLMSLWYYVIILPEEEDYSQCFMLNLIIGELKQILESCGRITIKYNNIKFVINASGHGGNCSWSIFRLENLVFGNHFTKCLLLGLINIKGIHILLVLVMIVIQKLILQVNSNSKKHISMAK